MSDLNLRGFKSLSTFTGQPYFLSSPKMAGIPSSTWAKVHFEQKNSLIPFGVSKRDEAKSVCMSGMCPVSFANVHFLDCIGTAAEGIDDEEDVSDVHIDATLQCRIEFQVAGKGFDVAVKGKTDEFSPGVEHS